MPVSGTFAKICEAHIKGMLEISKHLISFFNNICDMCEIKKLKSVS